MLVQQPQMDSPPIQQSSWEDPLGAPGQFQQSPQQPIPQPQPPSQEAIQQVGEPPMSPHYVSRVESGAISEARKTAYIIIAILVAGLAMLIFGIMAFNADTISGDLKGLGDDSFASVIIFCSPCGPAQETSLRGVMGDGYNYRFQGSLQDNKLLANLSGLEVKHLAQFDWVKKLVQNTGG